MRAHDAVEEAARIVAQMRGLAEDLKRLEVRLAALRTSDPDLGRASVHELAWAVGRARSTMDRYARVIASALGEPADARA